HGYSVKSGENKLKEYKPHKMIVPSRNTLDEFYIHLENNKLLSAPWTALFKREIIEHYNLEFPPLLKYGEDVNFLIQYMSYCESFMSIDSILYNNQKDNFNSLSSGYIKDMHIFMEVNQKLK